MNLVPSLTNWDYGQRRHQWLIASRSPNIRWALIPMSPLTICTAKRQLIYYFCLLNRHDQNLLILFISCQLIKLVRKKKPNLSKYPICRNHNWLNRIQYYRTRVTELTLEISNCKQCHTVQWESQMHRHNRSICAVFVHTGFRLRSANDRETDIRSERIKGILNFVVLCLCALQIIFPYLCSFIHFWYSYASSFLTFSDIFFNTSS